MTPTHPAPAAHDTAQLARTATRIVIACASAFLGTYALAVHTALGQRLDDTLMVRPWYASPTFTAWCNAALAHYHQATYGLAAGVLLLVGLATRGPRRALAAAATLVAIVASAEALKHGMSRPDFADYTGPLGALTANSFPSGHTAGIAGLACSAVVLAPARHRRLVAALGALGVAAVGVALVVAQWHRPSDILGSALLAMAWGAVGVVAAEAAAVRVPAQVTRRGGLSVLPPTVFLDTAGSRRNHREQQQQQG